MIRNGLESDALRGGLMYSELARLPSAVVLLIVLLSGCLGSPPAAPLPEPMPMVLDSTFSCDSLVKRLVLPPDAATLVHQSLKRHDGEVVRWPREHMPLSVWIQSPPPVLTRTGQKRPAHELTDWTWAISSALDHWSAIVPGVAFAMTSDSAAAEVHVTWVLTLESLPGSGMSRSAGRSAVLRDRSTSAITAAHVMLAQLDDDGRRLSFEDVHVIAGHEIGHVLGLGHQLDALSVMAPSVRVDGATLADRSAARSWYSLPLGLACRSDELQ